MLFLVHMRAKGRQLARQLRRSMLTERESWAIDADRQGRPILSRGRFRIAIVPRNLRIFDEIHVFCDEVEVWLPLLPRVRLRNAARFIVLRYALDEWANPSAEPCPVPLDRTQAQHV